MKVLSALLVSALAPFAAVSQINLPEKIEMPHALEESPRLPYLPNAYNNQLTTPATSYRSAGVFTIQVNVDSAGRNIVGDAANEPSIAVDPLNPDHIVIGWRQFDNVGSDFRQAGLSFSDNAGYTWTNPGVILEPGVFRSDPVLGWDNDGSFYYNSLTFDGSNYLCKVFKSLDGGADWNAGVDAKGGDKQWMTIDHTNGIGSGNIYATWNYGFTSCNGNFTRSVDAGTSFGNCSLVTNRPYWGTMAVGNNGELYVSGSVLNTGIDIVKSTNASDSASAVIWDFDTHIDMDGAFGGNPPINPSGLLGQACVDVDHSDGPGRDNVYVLASLQRVSNSDPGDVMFAKSTDGGLTWSNPIRVNDDQSTTNTQWFGTMSVAPNGRIDAVWLDTRDDHTGWGYSALYYSYSVDQGDSWSVNQKISASFDPHKGYPMQNKMGDYFDMTSGNTGAHLAWSNTLTGGEDVYYSFINPLLTGSESTTIPDNYLSVSCYPNPCQGSTTIRYQIPAESNVSLKVYDVFGREINTLITKNIPSGIYNIVFPSDDLQAGYYIIRLSNGNSTASARLVKM